MKDANKSILIAIIICSSTCLVAQNTIDKTIETVEKTVETLDATAEKLATQYRDSDTSYIKFYDEVSAHLYTVLHLNSFQINDTENNTSIHYKPVRSPSFGFGFSKYGFTINFSNDFSLIKQSEQKFGETKKLNLKISFIYKKMWISSFFSKYKGYYISNYEDFVTNLNNNEIHPQREDVETIAYGLSYMHVFNSQKFSLNSSYTLTQKQLKSAGSFLIGTGFNAYSISGDSSLIPSLVKEHFSPYTHANKISQQLYEISIGYSYNLVFLKHLNLNITAITSAALSSSDITAENYTYSTTNYIDISPKININSALSYVRARFYSGANIKLQQSFTNTGDHTSINTAIISAQIFAGYRLGTRKKKKKNDQLIK